MQHMPTWRTQKPKEASDSLGLENQPKSSTRSVNYLYDQVILADP